jgi:hypothetical protein
VASAKWAIVVTFFTGAAFALIMLSAKFGNQSFAFTHWFNEATYYIKNGFVVLILAAVFLLAPSRRLVFGALLWSVPFYYGLQMLFPAMNYFVRSGWVISVTFLAVAIPTLVRTGWALPEGRVFHASSRQVAWLGLVLAASLITCHVVFH